MKLSPPLLGILFDFDGLIVDTEMPIFQAWKMKFREFGEELLVEDWGQIVGKSSNELGPLEDFLARFADPEEKEKVLAEVAQAERTLVEEQRPLPGAEELIERSHAAGLQLGIVSSSDQDWVHSHLDRLGLLGYFHHTSCADEVETAKPDPALYHLGLEKMSLPPDRVVVLEDSPHGVLAAKRAGLFCIAVPNQLTGQLPFFKNGGSPDLVINTLEDFPWDDFMRVDP